MQWFFKNSYLGNAFPLSFLSRSHPPLPPAHGPAKVGGDTFPRHFPVTGVGWGCQQAGAGQPGHAAPQMFPFLPLWLHVNDGESYTDICPGHLPKGKDWLQFGSTTPVVMKREKLKYLAPGKVVHSTAILDQRPRLCSTAVAVAGCTHREPRPWPPGDAGVHGDDPAEKVFGVSQVLPEAWSQAGSTPSTWRS